MSPKMKKALYRVLITGVAGICFMSPMLLSTGNVAQASTRHGVVDITSNRISKFFNLFRYLRRHRRRTHRSRKYRHRRSKRRRSRKGRKYRSRKARKRNRRRRRHRNSGIVNGPIGPAITHIRHHSHRRHRNSGIVNGPIGKAETHIRKHRRNRKRKSARRSNRTPRGRVYWRGGNKMIGNKIIVHAHGRTYYVPESAEGDYGKTSVYEFKKWRHIISPKLHYRTPSNTPYLPYIFGDAHTRIRRFHRAETSRTVWNRYYKGLPFKDFVGKINIMIGESGGQWNVNRAGRFQMIYIPKRYVGTSVKHQIQEEKYALHYLKMKHIKNWAVAGYMECHRGY